MIKIFKNRRFQIIVTIIATLVVILLSADRFSKVNIIRNIVTVPVTVMQKGAKAAGEWFDGIISGIRDYTEVVQENIFLKNENLELKEKNAGLTEMEEENKRLKKALLLKNRFSDYNIQGANIIGSNPGNFLYNFRIDVGSANGVEIDDPVVAANNVLVGRVVSVGINSSTIVPFIDERSGVSAWTTKPGGGHAVIKGDIEYKDKGLCLLDTISEGVVLTKGDILETSGMGGIYPRGILIGTVEEIYKETSVVERYAVIRPLVDFNAIEEIYILSEKDSGEE